MTLDISNPPAAGGEPPSAIAVLRDSLERAQLNLEAALDAVINMDEAGRVTGWSRQAERMFGYSQAQTLGREVAELIVPPAHREAHRQGMARYIRTATPTIVGQRVEVRGMRVDGSEFPIELTIAALLQNGIHFFCAHIRDITDRKLAEEDLRIAAVAFESHEGMAITDADGVILRVNHTFTAITGYSVAEALGQRMSLLRSGRQDQAFYEAMWAHIQQAGAWQGEIWNRRKSGEVYPEWLTVTAVRSGRGQITHYVGTFTDITKRKAADAEIQQLAFYDPLTGLPNRRLLTDRLRQALAGCVRSHHTGALLFIDLDHFKNLNDTLGHDQGDVLLQQVARRLNGCVREGDTVARLGGDEFVVMLQDLSDSLTEAAARAEAVGEKILVALRQPYQFSQLTHHSSASLGVA